MGLFDRIFGGKDKAVASLAEEDATAIVPIPESAIAATETGVELQQAVIVRFAYGDAELGPLFELQARLEAVVEEGRLGEVDGHEVAMDGGAGALYLYGPDADALFAAAKPALEGAGFMKGAKVVVRYGGAGDGAREKVVVIGG